MPRPDLARVRREIDTLANAWEPMRSALGLNVDCCVTAAWVGQVYLARRQIGAQVYPVKAIALNQAAAAYVTYHGHLPILGAEDAPGCWSVGVGFPLDDPPPASYNGHVVLIVESRYLLDLSIAQADRPHLGIAIGQPIWFECQGRSRGTVSPRFKVWAGQPGHCVIRYGGYPEAPDYRATPAWGNALVNGLVLDWLENTARQRSLAERNARVPKAQRRH